MSPLSFQALLDNLKRAVDPKPASEIEWLTELLNITEAMTDDQFTETLQTLMTMRDQKKEFNGIMRGLR